MAFTKRKPERSAPDRGVGLVGGLRTDTGHKYGGMGTGTTSFSYTFCNDSSIVLIAASCKFD